MKTKDHADVLARPPLLCAGALIISLVLQRFWPIPIVSGASLSWAVIFLLLPVALILWGRRSLVTANTAVDPSRSTMTIVTSGPFHFSRNPLYLGLTAIYLDLTAVANSWWGAILLAPLLILMHFGVVRREERYLDRKFGESYRRYRATVPRY